MHLFCESRHLILATFMYSIYHKNLNMKFDQTSCFYLKTKEKKTIRKTTKVIADNLICRAASSTFKCLK